MDNGNNSRKEIDEAIAAGERALAALKEASGCLDSARGWGLFDLLGGKGITSFIKQEKMSHAQQLIDKADYELQCFNRELADVRLSESIRVSSDGLVQFIDIFADNIFVDFMVQSRIADAQRKLQDTIRAVQRTLDRLYQAR